MQSAASDKICIRSQPTDPEMQDKLAAREAANRAREARRAEREALKTAENERILAEAAALAAAAEAEQRAEAEARRQKLPIGSRCRRRRSGPQGRTRPPLCGPQSPPGVTLQHLHPFHGRSPCPGR